MDINFSLFQIEVDLAQMTMTSKRYLIACVNSFILTLGNLIWSMQTNYICHSNQKNYFDTIINLLQYICECFFWGASFSKCEL